MAKNGRKQGKAGEKAGKGRKVEGAPGTVQGERGSLLFVTLHGQGVTYTVRERPADLIGLYEQGYPIRATLESGDILCIHPRVVLAILPCG